MLQHIPEEQSETADGHVKAECRSYSLQFILWSLWTLMVVVRAYFSWRVDVVAQRPINTLGLVLHCVVAGVIGLVVMTVIEMRLEPWCFLQ